MALSSVGDLRTSILSWAERNDLTNPQLNDFIALTETYVNRVLRVPSMEWKALISSTDGRIVIPFDFLSLKNISWLGADSTSQNRYDLESATWERVNTERLIYRDVHAPKLFARQENFWYISTTPADGDVFEVHYYRFTPGLNDTTQTDNWLLQVAPEVYLFGGLYFTYMFLQDENKAQYWKALFDSAIASVQLQGNESDQGHSHGRVKNLDMMGGET